MKLHELLAEGGSLINQNESVAHYDVVVMDHLNNILGEVEEVIIDNDGDNDKLIIGLRMKE